MRSIIRVISTPSLRQKYNRLTSSDWKKSTLDEALTLLWKELEVSEPRPAFFKVLKPDRSGITAAEFDPTAIEELRHFRRHFHGNDLIPPIPEVFAPGRRSRLHAQAETTWTYLVLDSLADVQGETGFFADSQSLLFLLTIDFLLDALDEAGHSDLRNCLLNALYMHTFITWTQDPQRQAHHFFLQAALMDYLGHPELGRENLRHSLDITPLEDHSFLTKVQAYVFSLMDAGADDQAKQFLMSLYRRAPEAYLSELQEMIDNVRNHAPARGS